MKPVRIRGLGLLEVVFAMVILITVTLPVVRLSTGSARSSAGSHQRAVLNLRARRFLAEMMTTPFELLRYFEGQAYPVELPDPEDPDGYDVHLEGIEEVTGIVEQAPGLILMLHQIDYPDRASRGQTRRILARRLKADPLTTFQARYPF